MSKYVRRIIPFGSGDIPAVQRWLEDMAEKGLFFKECGLLFAKFTRGEPKKMRYRLDFCDVVACDIPDEKKELYEQSGWQVAGDYNSDLVVVCTDEPDAPEIYTDPELLVKPLKKLAVKYMTLGIVFLIMSLFTQLTNFTSVIRGYTTLLEFFMRFRTVYAVLILIMSLLLLIIAIVQFSSCRRIKKLADGAAVPVENRRSAAIARRVLTVFGAPLAIVWIVHWLTVPLWSNAEPVSDLSSLPFPTAEEVVQMGDYDETEAWATTDAFMGKEISLVQEKGVPYKEWGWTLRYRAKYFEAPTEWLAKQYAGKYTTDIKENADHSLCIGMNNVTYVRDIGDWNGNIPRYRQEMYEIDGAEVFWQFSGDIAYPYGDNYFIIRLDNKVLNVYCEGTSRVVDQLPRYISLLKSAK